jgi:hypothetical protein
VSDQVSHPYKTTEKSIVLYILIITYFIVNWKINDSATKVSNIPWLQSALNFYQLRFNWASLRRH